METSKTKVIFRFFQNEVVAIFPEEPATSAYDCTSYAHIGQHSGCDPNAVIKNSRPATSEEYAALKAELEAYGYTLEVIQRLRYSHYQQRQAEMKRLYALANNFEVQNEISSQND